MDAGNVKWVRLGDYIEQCDERNHSNKYGIEAIKGISTSKTLLILKPILMVYLYSHINWLHLDILHMFPDTSRRGDKVALAFNDSSCTYLISSIFAYLRSLFWTN